jgi:hypothetical protein
VLEDLCPGCWQRPREAGCSGNRVGFKVWLLVEEGLLLQETWRKGCCCRRRSSAGCFLLPEDGLPRQVTTAGEVYFQSC